MYGILRFTMIHYMFCTVQHYIVELDICVPTDLQHNLTSHDHKIIPWNNLQWALGIFLQCKVNKNTLKYDQLLGSYGSLKTSKALKYFNFVFLHQSPWTVQEFQWFEKLYKLYNFLSVSAGNVWSRTSLVPCQPQVHTGISDEVFRVLKCQQFDELENQKLCLEKVL